MLYSRLWLIMNSSDTVLSNAYILRDRMLEYNIHEKVCVYLGLTLISTKFPVVDSFRIRGLGSECVSRLRPARKIDLAVSSVVYVGSRGLHFWVFYEGDGFSADTDCRTKSN